MGGVEVIKQLAPLTYNKTIIQLVQPFTGDDLRPVTTNYGVNNTFTFREKISLSLNFGYESSSWSKIAFVMWAFNFC